MPAAATPPCWPRCGPWRPRCVSGATRSGWVPAPARTPSMCGRRRCGRRCLGWPTNWAPDRRTHRRTQPRDRKSPRSTRAATTRRRRRSPAGGQRGWRCRWRDGFRRRGYRSRRWCRGRRDGRWRRWRIAGCPGRRASRRRRRWPPRSGCLCGGVRLDERGGHHCGAAGELGHRRVRQRPRHGLAPDPGRQVTAVHLPVVGAVDGDVAERMGVAPGRVTDPDRGGEVRREAGEPSRAVALGGAGLAGGRPVELRRSAGTAAGKTGTTEGYGAAWFTGFTPDLAAAVWIGDPTGGNAHPLRNVTINGAYYRQVYGGDLPARIWRQTVSGALADAPVAEFTGGAAVMATPFVQPDTSAQSTRPGRPTRPSTSPAVAPTPAPPAAPVPAPAEPVAPPAPPAAPAAGGGEWRRLGLTLRSCGRADMGAPMGAPIRRPVGRPPKATPPAAPAPTHGRCARRGGYPTGPGSPAHAARPPWAASGPARWRRCCRHPSTPRSRAAGSASRRTAPACWPPPAPGPPAPSRTGLSTHRRAWAR